MVAKKQRAEKPLPKTLFKRIHRCIDERVRPYIQMDGGDIELLELTSKKVLKVRFTGACHGCPMASYTLEYNVKAALDETFPKENIQVLLVE